MDEEDIKKEKEILEEIKEEEEALKKEREEFEKKELEVMREILNREKQIEKEEAMIEAKEDSIKKEEHKIESLLNQMKKQIGKGKIYNFEDWIQLIWDACEFKKKDFSQETMSFNCKKSKDICTYHKCPLNKR